MVAQNREPTDQTNRQQYMSQERKPPAVSVSGGFSEAPSGTKSREYVEISTDTCPSAWGFVLTLTGGRSNDLNYKNRGHNMKMNLPEAFLNSF